jgi:hypothetical protein
MNKVHDTGCLVRWRKPAQACARQGARIEINEHLAIKEAFLGVHGSSPIPIVRKPEKEEYHNRLPDAQGIYIYMRDAPAFQNCGTLPRQGYSEDGNPIPFFLTTVLLPSERFRISAQCPH